MSYMNHILTMQMGIRNVNMYSYCIMNKLLNSTVDNLTPTSTHTSLEIQKQDRKSLKSMYFYIFQYFILETLII